MNAAMVLSADHERVKLLLKDTITLLCRNGLAFKSKFNIEALIGVTLDDDDVFLVSINEIVKSEQALAAEALKLAAGSESSGETEDDSQENDNASRAGTGRRRHRKRKRNKIKSEGVAEEHPDDDYSEEDGNTIDQENSNASIPPSAKKSRESVKREQDSDDEDNDIVFIKQELDSSWPPQSTSQDDSSYPADHSFNLSDVNLTPVGQQEGAEMWSPMGGQQQRQQHRMTYNPRVPRTSTVTSGDTTQEGDMQQTQHMGADGQTRSTGQYVLPGSSPRRARAGRPARAGFTCQLCGTSLVNTSTYNRHMKLHMGKFKYYCSVCSKGFMDRTNLARHLANAHNICSA